MNQQPMQPSVQQPQQTPTEAPKGKMGMLLIILLIVVVAAIAVWYFFLR